VSAATRLVIRDPDDFFEDFPLLKTSPFSVTSPASDDSGDPQRIYNCFAYAVGIKRQWWWPELYGHWPPNCERKATIDSILCALAEFRFSPCGNADFENGLEKVAIYAKGDKATHVAVQFASRNGKWRSKCGTNVDIEHDLDQLNGPCYGTHVKYAARSTSRRVLAD
jgi:hypothetical protein